MVRKYVVAFSLLRILQGKLNREWSAASFRGYGRPNSLKNRLTKGSWNGINERKKELFLAQSTKNQPIVNFSIKLDYCVSLFPRITFFSLFPLYQLMLTFVIYLFIAITIHFFCFPLGLHCLMDKSFLAVIWKVYWLAACQSVENFVTDYIH